jgi:hypothetical protein
LLQKNFESAKKEKLCKRFTKKLNNKPYQRVALEDPNALAFTVAHSVHVGPVCAHILQEQTRIAILIVILVLNLAVLSGHKIITNCFRNNDISTVPSQNHVPPLL